MTHYVMDVSSDIKSMFALGLKSDDKIILLRSLWKNAIKQVEKSFMKESKIQVAKSLLYFSHLQQKGMLKFVGGKKKPEEKNEEQQLLDYCKQLETQGKDVVLVTQDILLTLKADILGINTLN